MMFVSSAGVVDWEAVSQNAEIMKIDLEDGLIYSSGLCLCIRVFVSMLKKMRVRGDGVA